MCVSQKYVFFLSPITKHKFSLHQVFQAATSTGIKINPRMAFPVKQTNLVPFIFFFQVTSLLPSAESSPQTLGGCLKELCSQTISPSLNPKMFLPDPKWGKVLSITNAAAFILWAGTISKDAALLLCHWECTATKPAQQNVAFTSHDPAGVYINPSRSIERSGWRAVLQPGIKGAGQPEPAGRANHSLGSIKEPGKGGLSHWPLQTGHLEVFLYQEGGQMLEVASCRGGQCLKPVSSPWTMPLRTQCELGQPWMIPAGPFHPNPFDSKAQEKPRALELRISPLLRG